MNVLDNPQGQFVVLSNNRHEMSLWPSFKQLPGGWVSAFGPADKEACFAYIEEATPSRH